VETRIDLHNWNEFVGAFYNAGIDVQMDTSDTDDARMAKNIIHQFPKPIEDGAELSSLWKRIDFGYESVKIDFEKLSKFLYDRRNRKKLVNALRTERYEMILLAMKYLLEGTKMNEVNIGRLDAYVGDYRRSSLRHHASRGLGIAEPKTVYLEERTEALI